MKRKLIIHVGMGKTGSSSIQKTLREARNVLEESGVKYLGLMLEHLELPNEYSWHQVSGWGAFLSLESVQAQKELADALIYADETLPESINTLVWSNESLFDRPDDVSKAIEEVKDRYQICVVGYIRRPDSWITSAYLQWGVKHKTYRGPLKPFRAWSSGRPYVVSPKIKAWEALAHTSTFFNFDVVPDIAGHFVESIIGKAGDVPSLRANDTPPPVVMALFAYHNSLAEGQVLPEELGPLLRASGLFNKQQKTVPYNRLLPTEDDISNYVETQSEEISRVNEMFKINGHPEFDLSTLKVKDYSASPLDINRAMLQLIFHLYSEIESLKKKLD